MTGPVEILAGLVDWLAHHQAELIAFRRNLHARPELSRQEYATTELIAERLELAGLAVRRMSVGTGVIAELAAPADDETGPTIVLRADIDALAMDDEKDVPYRSRVPGVAHACGHDVHTTIVLGAALYLASSAAVPGTVRFVFQPAEETVPGGALDALADGALVDADAVIAAHCEPKLDAGVIALRRGPITSAADSLRITLSGPGGHTARPELTVDLISLSARIVTELPGSVETVLAGDMAMPVEMKMVFGAIHAGDAANVIPTQLELKGSVRTPSLEVWERLEDAVGRALDRLLSSTLVDYDLEYVHGVPPVVNDPQITDLIESAARRLEGGPEVVEAPRSWGGDDFAWFTRLVPGSYFRLGVHDPRWGSGRLDLHAGHFDVDERAIATGVAVMVGTVAEALRHHDRES